MSYLKSPKIASAILTICIHYSLFAQIPSVRIGKQIWMSENLNTHNFNNGDSINTAKNSGEWAKYNKCGLPACCYYNFDIANAKYGLLYNECAIKDPRGIAPEGYRVPTINDWAVLFETVGGKDTAGKKLKSQSNWQHQDRYLNGNGDNNYGFNALPAGYYSSHHRRFLGNGLDTKDKVGFDPNIPNSGGKTGIWWSTSEYIYFWRSEMYHRLKCVSASANHHGFSYVSSDYGDKYSVRCIKSSKNGTISNDIKIQEFDQELKLTEEGTYIGYITNGAGETPQKNDAVKFSYTAKLSDGTLLDSVYAHTVQIADLLPFWQNKLLKMKAGSEIICFIPADVLTELGHTLQNPKRLTIIYRIRSLEIIRE